MASTRCWAGWLVLVASLLLTSPAAAEPPVPADLAHVYSTTVDRRLQVPPEEVQGYAALTERAFAQAFIRPEGAQYVAVVDRDPEVQALLLFWRSAQAEYWLVGASPVSTGTVGSFDHFATPRGVLSMDRGTRTSAPRAPSIRTGSAATGSRASALWVLDAARQTVADPGRYLVVVDSERQERPAWSPAPAPRHRRVAK